MKLKETLLWKCVKQSILRRERVHGTAISSPLADSLPLTERKLLEDKTHSALFMSRYREPHTHTLAHIKPKTHMQTHTDTHTHTTSQ